MNKKIASEIAIGIILLLAIVIGGIFYWQNKLSMISDQQPEQRACTEEAKLCADGTYVSRTGPNCEFAPCSETKSAQLANPASTYCVENGGKSEIRTNPDGSQMGYCKFNDGSECEEWAYFRKECGNEAADWQTYKNEKYGFEFKYPLGYTSSKSSTNKSSSEIESVVFKKDTASEFVVKIIDQKLKTEFFYESSNSVVKLDKILIGSQEWYKMFLNEGGPGGVSYSANLGLKTIKVLFSDCSEDWRDVPALDEGKCGSILYNDIAMQKQILSTFKFTK